VGQCLRAKDHQRGESCPSSRVNPAALLQGPTDGGMSLSITNTAAMQAPQPTNPHAKTKWMVFGPLT
jgi:hypothetical protein